MVKIGCACKKTFGTKPDTKKPKQKHANNKLVCKDCGKRMIGTDKLRFHMDIHESQKDFYCGPKKTFQCYLCNKNFLNKQYLVKHVKSHKKDKTIKCKKFGHSAQSLSALKEHSRSHNEVQDSECGVCNKEIFLKNIAIAEEEAFQNRNKIIKQFKQFSENPEGIEMQKMWKVMKNICPKLKPILPSAKKNIWVKLFQVKKI